MATTLYANNVAAVTAADIGPSDTILILSGGQGAAFPSPNAQQYFWATLIHPVSHVVEIVQCTSRSADTLTLVRGRDGTSATAFPAGSVIEMRLNAEQLREANWRLTANTANGVLQLDAGAKAPKSTLPSELVYQVDGLIPASLLPPELLTETEGDARYGRLDQAETWAENQTFNKDVNLLGVLNVGNVTGTNTGRINLGDDAFLSDVGESHTIGVTSRTNAAWGFIRFGTGGKIGWNGSYLLWGVNQIWHSGSFDPATKTNRNSGELADGRILNFSGNPNSGTLFWGAANDAIQTYNGTNFTFTKNIYAPNLVASSDETLKKEIRKAPALRNIGDMVELVSWAWRKRRMIGAPAGRWSGVIAQAVKKYAPWHVTESEDGVLGVDKAGLALEVAVDDARRIRELETKVAELQALIKKTR